MSQAWLPSPLRAAADARWPTRSDLGRALRHVFRVIHGPDHRPAGDAMAMSDAAWR